MPALPRPIRGGLDRRVAAPLVVLTCPPLFLVYREATRCPTPAGCSEGALAGYLLVAPFGVPAAVLLARLVVQGRAPAWLAPRPNDPTLATLAGIVLAVDAYLVLAMLGAVGPAMDRLAAGVGLLLGLPLVLSQVVVVAAGNAVGEPPMAVRLATVAVGVALSATWWYVLAAAVGRLTAVAWRALADAPG